jgi:MerR family transcriptional regulator, redox-sensitive transcriptional activator SoxR
MEPLTIGEVSRRTGLRPSALRYYESEGLLDPPRRVGGRRRYDDAALTRLALIRMAQEAGFTIEEIRTLIDGFSAETPAGDRWRTLARQKLVEVGAQIVRAQTMRRVLQESLRCGCLSLEECAATGWGDSGPSGDRADVP